MGGIGWFIGMNPYTFFSTIMPPNSPSCGATTNNGASFAYTASSYHSGGVNAARADGSVMFVSNTINAISNGYDSTTARCKLSGASDFGVWGALGTRSGGESTTL